MIRESILPEDNTPNLYTLKIYQAKMSRTEGRNRQIQNYNWRFLQSSFND